METYKTVCNKCGRKTWYEEEQQCHCEYPKKKHCDKCGHTEVIEPVKMVRCTGTLVKISDEHINHAFDRFYNTDIRIEVAFCDSEGKEYERKRGTIGKTTGWKPSYLLMLRRDSIGSSYLINHNTKFLRVI